MEKISSAGSKISFASKLNSILGAKQNSIPPQNKKNELRFGAKQTNFLREHHALYHRGLSQKRPISMSNPRYIKFSMKKECRYDMVEVRTSTPQKRPPGCSLRHGEPHSTSQRGRRSPEPEVTSSRVTYTQKQMFIKSHRWIGEDSTLFQPALNRFRLEIGVYLKSLPLTSNTIQFTFLHQRMK